MLIISKQQVENLIHRLNDSAQLKQCQDELREMIEIKSALLWWAESGKCCAWQPGVHFAGEIQVIEDALGALEEGNISRAVSLLQDYAIQLE